MNSEYAIEVQNVTKYFKSYTDKGNMLREKLIHIGRNKYEKRIILDNISFNIKKGEAVALIGKNGCGKSTTLKMLTRILRPNSGTIKEAGRVSSLIELGAGFHPDLTGRENIYINASIFGIKAKEVDQRIDDIIRFSELEEYIDNPVRTYSSGMYMRLAFAVAINVKADILLIDEILAVGDQAFQTKCFNKLQSLKEEGVTIVIVSHSLDQVQKICDRAIWIEAGRIRKDDAVRIVCKEYLEVMEENRRARAEKELLQQLEEEASRISQIQDENERKEADEKHKRYLSCRDICSQCGTDARRSGSGLAHYTEVELFDKDDRKSLRFKTGESLKLKLKYDCKDEKRKLNFVVGITRSDWIFCYGTTTLGETGRFISGKQSGELEFCINKLVLVDGKYVIDLWINDSDGNELDCIHSLMEFEIANDEMIDKGIAYMDANWSIR